MSKLRKLNDDEFLAARDVDFATEAVITDDPVMAPPFGPADAHVTLTHYAPDEQRVTTQSSAPFYLASSEKLTPELRVTIDGNAVRAIDTDMLFAGVTVPAGRHEIVFSRRIGRGWWWFAALGVGLWIVAVGFEVRRRFTSSCDEDDLVGEQPSPDARERGQQVLAEAEDRLRHPGADDQADRDRRAAHFEDAEAGVFDFAADGALGVEAQMGVVEDAAVAVFEDAERGGRGGR